MDRLDAMSLFLTIVQEGSLAGAARKAGCSTATVTRAVALLETRLGQRLLHRSTRRMRLTEAGHEQLALYRRVLAELSGSGLEQTGVPEIGASPAPGLTGRIGITAPELFGRRAVMPVLDGFLAEHPAVRARALLLNRVVDLAEEGIDVAVRFASLADSGLIAVRLGDVHRLVCASPSYLAHAGVPVHPKDLAGHDCIGTEDGNERLSWRFANRQAQGRAISVALHARSALNSAGAAIDTALRGGGLCRPLSYQVADHLADGRLISVLTAFEPQPIPVHLVFHPIPARHAVLRAFVDYAVPRLREDLAAIGRPGTGP